MISVTELQQQAKALLAQQQFGPAQGILAQWLLQVPDDAEAHYLMAGAYGNTGEFAQAENHCREAIRVKPDYFEAIFRLANALDGLGNTTEALIYFQQALDINPSMPHVWNNMGACQISQKDYSSAEYSYRKAIDLDNKMPHFYFNLALALIPQSISESNKLTEAVKYVKKAQEFSIELADQLYFDTMLGISFLTFNDPVNAEKHFLNNLVIESDNPESHLNLALSLVAQNREQEALHSIKLAQQSCNGQQNETVVAEIAWTMGLIYLGLGQYSKAWPLYEYRWKRNNHELRHLPKSLWAGESLNGKTIYLFHEQGFGDNIQFARYFSMLKQQGAEIIYECQKPLARLFSSIEFIDKLIVSGQEPGKFDYYLPLASLPGVLNTTFDNIPYIEGNSGDSIVDQKKGYLPVPVDDFSKIDEQLNSIHSKKRVGIFWRGSGSQVNDKRPCNLEYWIPLLELSDISFVSLQKDYVTEQDELLFQQYGVLDMRPLINDFADTAYIISQLDFVITIDTSVAHLVGALGGKGKVLLAYASDWRWGRESSNSSWYPSLTLYRQDNIASWASVIEGIKVSLEQEP